MMLPEAPRALREHRVSTVDGLMMEHRGKHGQGTVRMVSPDVSTINPANGTPFMSASVLYSSHPSYRIMSYQVHLYENEHNEYLSTEQQLRRCRKQTYTKSIVNVKDNVKDIWLFGKGLYPLYISDYPGSFFCILPTTISSEYLLLTPTAVQPPSNTNRSHRLFYRAMPRNSRASCCILCLLMQSSYHSTPYATLHAPRLQGRLSKKQAD